MYIIEDCCSLEMEFVLNPLLHYGETRSGKSIGTLANDDFEVLHNMTKGFTTSDYFDAFALFEYMLQRELSRQNMQAMMTKFSKYAVFHRSQLTLQSFDEEKSKLGLSTIFHITKHGKNLVDPLL